MSLQPFAKSAADYPGPFIKIQGRSVRRAKQYLCLFTCLNTQAMHLEMSSKMDTDLFFNAFLKMESQRGIPEATFFGNGGNFVKVE